MRRAFTEQDVCRLLDPDRLLSSMEHAFRERFQSVEIPPRLSVPLHTGIFLALSCHDRASRGFGMKLVKVFTSPAPGQDSVHATYLLLDPETAEPILTIAANYLTDLRTA